jgi:hypothetical protein
MRTTLLFTVVESQILKVHRTVDDDACNKNNNNNNNNNSRVGV